MFFAGRRDKKYHEFGKRILVFTKVRIHKQNCCRTFRTKNFWLTETDHVRLGEISLYTRNLVVLFKGYFSFSKGLF
jgi:hypothetical protein